MLPILLSIPHGGMRRPPELAGRVRLTAEELFDDSDALTREIYDLGDEVIQLVTTEIARAFVDLNRAIDDRPPANPDGVIKSVTVQKRLIYKDGDEPDDELVSELLDLYYHPYHRKLEVAAKNPGLRLALDCHSMGAVAPPIASDSGQPRPLFCLSNVDGLTCPDDVLEDMRRAFANAFECDLTDVHLNQPFKGGHITRRHGAGKVPWVQVEMNRSLYLDPKWFDRSTLSVDPERLQHLRGRFRAALQALAL